MLITVEPFPVAALAALFDDGLAAPGPGGPLPPYWQLAACAAPPPTGELGPDGHPRGGLVSAPPGLPRRMFAGGRLQLSGQVRVGDRLVRTAGVTASVDKQGRSGPLRFVTVTIRLARPGGEVLLTEEQDIVYRAPAPAAARPAAAPEPEPGPAPGPLLARDGTPLCAQFRAGPVALQRFSAATSNAHRIHYDHRYVTGVEGYPGLVVHGPLLLMSMLELIRLDLPGRAVTAVSFAARAPVFAGGQVTLAGELASGTVRLAARLPSGGTAMTCEATLA